MPSKIKLLYITNQICGAAGLERVLSIKARLLAESYQYDVHIITLNQGNEDLFYDFGNKIIYHNILVKGHPIKYIWQYSIQLNTKIKEIKPDLIAVCDDGLKAFFLPFILRKPCPMVYERHVSKEIENTTDKQGALQRLKNIITYSLMYFGGKHYNKFIVLTRGNLKEWPIKNIIVINNPLSFPKDVPKSTLNSNIVLAVGRQSYQKGYDRLLKSWKEVTKNQTNWQLHIYGKKDPSLGLDTLVKVYKLESSVRFFDPVKDISSIYQKASIFVLPSRFEGFGMVLIEAMIHGVPSVSFDCPFGPSDIINHNINGLLVENGNTKELSDAILKLINDEELRKSMGENAIKKAMKFSPENIIQQWDNLFKSLV